MKNIVITDKDIPLELFKESVIVNLNNIKYSACTGDYTCLKKRSSCRYHDDISVINQWIGEASLIILVTHIYCGCFDTPLKSFIERNIAHMSLIIQLWMEHNLSCIFSSAIKENPSYRLW